MRGRHVDEGTLQAYLDGELAPLASLRTRWHLARCASCRHALTEHRAAESRTASLLSSLASPIDTEAGWQRVTATHAPTGEEGRDAPSRPHAMHRLRWSLGGVAALLIIAAAVVHMAGSHSRMSTAASLLGEQVRDVCCFDLDGGGPGDDGILTLSRRGEQVDCVVVYDDIDRTRTFTAGDRARYASSETKCGRVASSRRSSTQHTVRVDGVPVLASAGPRAAVLIGHAER